MSIMSPGRAERDWSVPLIVVVWAVTSAAVNPIGDFPRYDDWAYGWSVKRLLESGTLQLSDWTAVSLLPQIYWGALFCLPIGFSFTMLRFSTLVAGCAGLLATNTLLKDAGAGKTLRLLGVATVAFNPLYFTLAHSFNSDIPSFALFIGALYFIARGFRRRCRLATAIGLGISFVAVLERQSNIVLLPAFGLAYLWLHELSLCRLFHALWPTCVGAGLQIAFSEWLVEAGRTPALYGFQLRHLVQDLASSPLTTTASVYGRNLLVMGIYLGAFLVPFLLSMAATRLRMRTPAILAAGVAVGVATVVELLMVGGRRMPLAGDILQSDGLGPQAIRGQNPAVGSIGRVVESWGWQTLTIAGAAGAAVGAWCFLMAVRKLFVRTEDRSERAILVLMLATSFFYFAGIGGLSPGYWFDRYLIPLLPPSMVLLLLIVRPPQGQREVAVSAYARVHAAGLAALVVFGAFTIAATHDSLASARVKWEAIEDLIRRRGVEPWQIAGGWEFAGWHYGQQLESCNPAYRRDSTRPPDWDDFTCLLEGENDSYTVSYDMEEGAVIDATVEYQQWLPWRGRRVYVLRRWNAL